MRAHKWCLAAIALCCAVVIGQLFLWRSRNTISHEKINDMTIIGQLGKPLGTIVTIRGKWTGMVWFKHDDLIFVVDSVDGKRLKKPAHFEQVDSVTYDSHRANPPHEVFEREEGVEWELRGVEQGKFHGQPDAVWDEVFKDRALIMPVAVGFRTIFCYIKPHRLDGEMNKEMQQTSSGKQ